MRRLGQIVLILLLALGIAGCGIRTMKEERETELSYTVVQREEIPEEIREMLEEEKREPFQMTYQSEDYLYIMRGYGLMDSGGYSIAVEKLVLRGNQIYCKTRLMGPEVREKITHEASYPYIVLKTEYRDEPVVFSE